ncbi:MAG: hypothetical protein Q4D98_00365 [Planctomycetia bacterium]|nr:hypothetical protein [Planctomycetia bacterium]
MPIFLAAKRMALEPIQGAVEGYSSAVVRRALAQKLFPKGKRPESFESLYATKSAAQVGLGDPAARALSRLGTDATAGSSLALFGTANDDPYDRTVSGMFSGLSAEDRKASLYRYIVEQMEKAHPDELKDVQINLGGTNLRRDLMRIMTNKRLGLLGFPLALLSLPGRVIGSTVGNINRSDHYDPITNSVNLYSDSPAVLTHELGHAIDENRHSPKELTSPSERSMYNLPGHLWDYIKTRVKNTKRDLYALGYGFDPLPYEYNANKYSDKAISKILAKEKEDVLAKLKALRQLELRMWPRNGTGAGPKSVPVRHCAQ